MKRLNLERNTLTIFMADHGDMQAGHSMYGKTNFSIYEETTRIPLLMRLPGKIPAGRVVAPRPGSADLRPTILDYLGFPAPEGVHGQQPAPLHGRQGRPRPPRLRPNATRGRDDFQRAIRTIGWKYVFCSSGESQLYNLEKDPGETRNLIADAASAAIHKQTPRRSRPLDERDRRPPLHMTIERRQFLSFPAVLAARRPEPPNIVFILTDDQRFDALGCLNHPFLRTPNLDRIRREGALFANAFVTTALCAPSRASFLTGTYAHRHGVTDNTGKELDPEKTPTFPQLMRGRYETAYIGKWHQAPRSDPRKGFDYWLSFKGQGVYTDPLLNENGREFKASGYMTDLLTEHALGFLQRKRDKPFCLYLAHKAIHEPFTPAERHKDLYRGVEVAEPPNYKDDLSSKPAWQRRRKDDPVVPPSRPAPPWNPHRPDRFMDYYRAISAVDEGVGRIYQQLEKMGALENTIIAFAGDNGYFKGEHNGRGDKRLMYEESIRIPFLMRYPGKIPAGSTIPQMALNIDLAQTLLEFAGVPAHRGMQGRSLCPLFGGNSMGWRTSWLYEYWVDLNPLLPRMTGVRTDSMKYVRYPDIDDIDEMYDLKTDPGELRNIALDPARAGEKKQLQAELARLLEGSLS